MQVTQLWRYPVKSLQGEQVERAQLGPLGVEGDRRWALFDVASGFGLTARREPGLLMASARTTADGGVEITLPDGEVAADDDALSAWLGREVRLRDVDDRGPRRYENPSDTETEEPGSWAPFTGSDGAFHDEFAMTILARATIGDREVRRFRPNVVVDAGDDDLVGAQVRLGEALVAVDAPVARCVMVTRPQPGGIEVDRDVLRWIHRERDGVLAVGSRVIESGTVRVGDQPVRQSGTVRG